MTDAERTARFIAQLIAKHEAGWPDDLKRKARFAVNALDVKDRPDNRYEAIQCVHKNTYKISRTRLRRPSSEER